MSALAIRRRRQRLEARAFFGNPRPTATDQISDVLRTELGEIRTELANVNGQLGGVNTRLNTLDGQLGRVTTELAHLGGQLGGVKSELGHLGGRVGNVATQLGKVAERLTAIEVGCSCCGWR
ncbi:hypothetical protein ABPG77_010142 [Micractinium sp. CCAP 211/92]